LDGTFSAGFSERCGSSGVGTPGWSSATPPPVPWRGWLSSWGRTPCRRVSADDRSSVPYEPMGALARFDDERAGVVPGPNSKTRRLGADDPLCRWRAIWVILPVKVEAVASDLNDTRPRFGFDMDEAQLPAVIAAMSRTPCREQPATVEAHICGKRVSLPLIRPRTLPDVPPPASAAHKRRASRAPRRRGNRRCAPAGTARGRRPRVAGCRRP
jgi:hypothetical protein